jgi:hypothetical protein
VDDLGNTEDAIHILKQLAHLPEKPKLYYGADKSLGHMLRQLGASWTAKPMSLLSETLPDFSLEYRLK